MQLRLLKHCAVVGDRHRQRLRKEVSAYLKLRSILLLGCFLLLGVRVFHRAWCAAVAGGLYLLMESDWHVCLLKLRGKLAESCHILLFLWVIIVDWLDIYLLIASDKDALGTNDSLCEDWKAIGSRIVMLFILGFFIVILIVLLLYLSVLGLTHRLWAFILHLLDQILVYRRASEGCILNVSLIRRFFASICVKIFKVAEDVILQIFSLIC